VSTPTLGSLWYVREKDGFVQVVVTRIVEGTHRWLNPARYEVTPVGAEKPLKPPRSKDSLRQEPK
jgi:hypothetical protein